MQPTEAELTAATHALARQQYEVMHAAQQELAAARGVEVLMPGYDELDPLERNRILEAVLPLAVVALEAIGDRGVAALRAAAIECETLKGDRPFTGADSVVARWLHARADRAAGVPVGG